MSRLTSVPSSVPSSTPASTLAPLLTAEGWALLSSMDRYKAHDALSLTQRLRRKGYSADLVSAALTQARLRAQAEAKFGNFAHSMIFTQTGLEQATRLPVAAHHARRFAEALEGSGPHRIVDLGCGIGADSLAFASLDLQVTAIDADETAAACATVNLMPFSNAQVHQAEATEVDLNDFDAVWLDPARRQAGDSGTRKLFDPETFSPPLSFASAVAQRGLAMGVKLGPGLPHSAIPEAAETQWTSIEGDLLEATLWFNATARPGVRRSALVLRSVPGEAPEQIPRQLTGVELSSPHPYQPEQQDAPLGPVSGYLYEPDPAVIRAGLVADLARATGAHLFDPHIAYLGSDTELQTPFARGYRVLEVLPYHLKTLKGWLRERNIGILEIKKRGMAVTPEELRRHLLPAPQRSAGQERRQMTLVLTRIGQERYAIAVDPLPATLDPKQR